MAPTREEIDAIIVPLLAGRAAEEVCLAAVSTGASGDLQTASRMLARAHAKCGLGGCLVYRDTPVDVLLASDADLRMAVEVDLQRLYAKALSLMRRERSTLDAIAEALIVKRFLSGEDIKRIVRCAKLPHLVKANE